MSGNIDKFKGKTKQAMGKVTDNKELQAKGKAQEVKGDINNLDDKLADKMDDTI